MPLVTNNNKNGVVKWVNRYDGPANSDDRATAIALDADDNVYITGGSTAATSDYTTIKYKTTGQLEWLMRYDGSGFDEAAAIGLDANNNVYVTGFSQGTGTGFDFATVKYGQAGLPKPQNEFSVEDFEIELTTALNALATKTNPKDVSYNRIKEVNVVIEDLRVEMLTDSTAIISRAELQRVYTKVRNEVWTAARNEFEAGKDRVLGFMLDEEIIVPPAPKGTIQDVTVKLTGLIGFGVNQMPSCNFQQDYYWQWYDPMPSYPSGMLEEIELYLNAIDPPCIADFLSTCPPPGKTVKNIPNGSVLYQIDGGDCMPATPFLCVLAVQSFTCSQPCPNWYFSTTDLQNIVDYARQEALNWKSTVLAQVPCVGYDVAPAPLFEIGSFEEIDGSMKTRHIVATYHYWGCGPCRAKSIKIQ